MKQSSEIVSSKDWYSSKEAKKILRITDCELMHRRIKGELIFKKVGRAYFYKLDQRI